MIKFRFFDVLNFFLFQLFFVFIFFMFSFISHGASDQDYFPIEQNKNGHFTDNDISLISNYFDDDTNYIVVYYFDYNYRAIVFPKSTYTNNLGQLCGEKNSALTHFSFYGLGVVPTTTYQFQIMFGSQIVNLQNFGSGFNYWQNLPSSNYDTSKDYISNLRIWTTNNSSKKLVIDYEEEPTYTDPDNDIYPNNFEQPQFSDYVDYNTAPSFDFTSLDSMVESLYNLIKWNFNTLVPGIVNYMIDGLNWALQKVINNIRNVFQELTDAIEDFVDSINGWLSDIKDQIDYIIEPIDQTAIITAFNQNGLIAVKNDFVDFYNDFDDIFRNTQEPTTFDITIDIQNVRTFYNFGCHDPVILHLGNNLNGTPKTIFRAFLWVLVIVGSIFLTEKNLSAWIKGGGFSDK